MLCKNCGSVLDEGAAFCSFCGAKVAPHENTIVSSEQQPTEIPKAPVPEKTAEIGSAERIIPKMPSPETVIPESAGTDPIQGQMTADSINNTYTQVSPAAGSIGTAPNPGPAAQDIRKAPATDHPMPGSSVNVSRAAPTCYPQSTPEITKPKKVKKEKVKTFFGGGALAFCLIIIGLLSASTGLFAYLYFSAIGMI